MTLPPENFLARAVTASRARIALLEGDTPLSELEERIWNLPPAVSFEAPLRGAERLHVIAEMKRSSPSAGLLAARYDPRRLARAYLEGGASAISVLTEPDLFGGELSHLRLAATSGLPILRKDFLVSPYQVAEARLAGADAVLLIVAALGEVGLRQMLQAAGKYGLAALVEIHDEEDIHMAAGCGARIVGVNSRDLRTLKIDSDRCAKLAPKLSRSVIRVAESGVSRPDQARALRQTGYDAVLVGEALMRAPDPVAALRALAEAGTP
ncbi:MAG TPA: indole-3-glycerol phosphate synthase TrpC [Verrucomicrobiae bacterium]|nr:indole-3-glycerol phosphate synthase TrpC [Verrucomicrobiae bacterium]